MEDRPVLVVAAGDDADTISTELHARYAHDYDIEIRGSITAAGALVKDLRRQGRAIALVMAQFRLSDGSGIMWLQIMRSVTPQSRRIALLNLDDFKHHMGVVMESSSRRDIDTYLVIPRGARDEEFHTAVAEQLSEWASTTAAPVYASLDLVAAPGDRRAARIRDVLGRSGSPVRSLTPDSPAGSQIVAAAGPDARLPIVRRTLTGSLLVDPSPGDVTEMLYGRPDQIPDGTVADLCIIGSGPAGLAAAVYGASEGLRTIVLESDAPGGQAGTSSMIRNYMGFHRGVSGMRLAQRARMQALGFGASFYVGRPAVKIDPGPDDQPEHHHVHVEGTEMCARAVVVSTGVSYRRLGVKGLDDLVGAGVHYGAATTAAREMLDRRVFVVGGGNSAGQAAVHLARFAREVTILIRRDGLTDTMSDYLIREIRATPKVRVQPFCSVVDGGGERGLEWIDIRRGQGEDAVVEREEADGLFLLIGATPHTDWLPETVARDDAGFVLTGRDVPPERWAKDRPPPSLGTSLRGVFAVGDVRAGSMKRVAAASGEGSSVAPQVHEYLAWLRSQQFQPRH